MLEIRFYETYYFCDAIRNILSDRFSFLQELEGFYCDDSYLYLITPFEKYSTFHKFIEFIVDNVYCDESYAVDLEERKLEIKDLSCIPSELIDLKPKKLPIELAFDFYEIEYISFVSYLEDLGKTFEMCDGDDVYEYMLELRLCGNYEVLVDQTVKEVFHILFQDRVLMLIFNDMIAGILEKGVENVIPDEFKKYFSSSGRLKRVPIPKWVKRAVFFRDRGRCVICNKDLSGIINLDNLENYDHIVPLAKHGLNDVSNIQLLCKECNQLEKKDNDGTTSDKYQSWYLYEFKQTISHHLWSSRRSYS